MKRSLTSFIFVISCLILNSQELDSLQMDYPFAEPGSKVTRGIYGTDDRMEVKDAKGYEDFVRATAVMVNKSLLVGDNFFKSESLRDRLTYRYDTDRFASDVKFLDQPTLGTCTGFLIAPDILITAGHCINSIEEANDYYWVLDYTKESEFVQDKYVKIEPENIFEVESLITSKLDDDTVDDYAVLRLKKKTDRPPYRFRTNGKAPINRPVYTIGSPTGLPLKFATNAVVKDTIPDNFFVTDIDTFPGNSGGPVFNENGFIEGIHVRGITVRDAKGSRSSSYIYDENCNCIKNVKYTKKQTLRGGGEAHNITEIPYYVLYQAIYENLEYAIKNNLADRFETWSVYNWVFNSYYANDNGRLENIAIVNNNIDALKAILEYTLDDLTDKQSRSLLNDATSSDSKDALIYLLDNGLLADAGEEFTYTLLQVAVMDKTNDLANLLISYGADINVKTSGGNTLLHIAAQYGNKDIIEQLIKSGLNVAALNNRKKRPEWMARKNKHRALSKYLKKIRKGKIKI